MSSLNGPDSSTWTLRLKLHRTTVFLFVTPTQSFTSIKADLLEAIKATGLKEINNMPVPADPEDILLGVAQDRKDPKRGWTGLEIPELDDLTGAKKGVRKGSVLNQTPQGAGLVNGQAMAFKFRTETSDDMLDDEWDVLLPTPDDYDEEEERKEIREEEEDEEEGGGGGGRGGGEEGEEAGEEAGEEEGEEEDDDDEGEGDTDL